MHARARVLAWLARVSRSSLWQRSEGSVDCRRRRHQRRPLLRRQRDALGAGELLAILLVKLRRRGVSASVRRTQAFGGVRASRMPMVTAPLYVPTVSLRLAESSAMTASTKGCGARFFFAAPLSALPPAPPPVPSSSSDTTKSSSPCREARLSVRGARWRRASTAHAVRLRRELNGGAPCVSAWRGRSTWRAPRPT